jgi:hypothetical protein
MASTFKKRMSKISLNKTYKTSIRFLTSQKYCTKIWNISRKKDEISYWVNIIINKDQKISFAKIYQIWQLPNIKEIIRVPEKMDINKTHRK